MHRKSSDKSKNDNAKLRSERRSQSHSDVKRKSSQDPFKSKYPKTEHQSVVTTAATSATSGIPSDEEAKRNLKLFVLRSLTDMTRKDRLEFVSWSFFHANRREVFKEIAKKTTSVAYEEWKSKRRPWTDYFYEKRQTKLKEYMQKYVQKKKRDETKRAK